MRVEAFSLHSSSPAIVAGVQGREILLFAPWVLGNAVWMAAQGIVPAAETMGIVGMVALVANFTGTAMLWRHRKGDANRRSVWICSRNDAIGNIAVVVTAIMAALALSDGWQIIHQARGELRRAPICRRTETAPLR